MDTERLTLYLADYYSNLYPWKLIIKWLTYSKSETDYLANREFAFILKDDIHWRFLSFANGTEFKEKLFKSIPYKIDIGAVYNRPPRDRKKIGDFIPQQRELVFDIDLTDYDPIRNCCKETNVCKKCWRWIIIAANVLERLLRGTYEHFGFNHLLWVFSGRRGIHCWVADKKARSLTGQARDAISKYLTFDKDGTAMNKTRVHPFVEQSYRIILDSGQFDHLVMEQGWLESEEKWSPILGLCADKQLSEALDSEFRQLKSPEYRWDMLKLRFDDVKRSETKEAKPQPVSGTAKNFLRLFVMQYAYPRLDAKVTAGLNHLLKAPFSVHPKNGKAWTLGNIAVPMNLKIIENLELENVPRIDQICAELRQAKKENAENGMIDYHQTSLAPYIALFEQWIDKLLQSEL